MASRRFVRELTAVEQKELTRLIHSGQDARMVRRAQMIRLSAQGQTTGQIARLWAMTPEVVRRIILHFNVEGLACLADKTRSGRPTKTTDRYIALLKEAVQTTPRDLGYAFSCWTLERLREYLARKTHIQLHPNYLSHLMAKNRIVYRRPKHSMSHLQDRQEYDDKKAILEFVKKKPALAKPASTCSTSMSVRFISTRP